MHLGSQQHGFAPILCLPPDQLKTIITFQLTICQARSCLHPF
ncbi:MAG TPA: hypothetical protein VKF38_05485 [Anaerolineaceae bacterium]|nr:hypothetical protein [Anaerolineaceae bacterium]